MNVPVNRARGFVRGFTLVELMVALGIFTIIMALIYSTWNAIMGATANGLKVAADVQRSRVAIDAVEDAILSSRMFTLNLKYYSFIVDKDGDYSSLALTSRLPKGFIGSGLYRDQVVRRVTFGVEPGADRQNDFVMTQMPILLETNAVLQPYSIVLAHDVQFFVLEFWDQRKKAWTDQLLTTNQLPPIVKVTLGVGSTRTPGVAAELMTRTIAIPSLPVPREAQAP
jgi:prepilin-type N-terminal cleavage/methylation domain-containing protein